MVVLLSGGVDSAVMLDASLNDGTPVFPLYVRQGFLWELEELQMLARFLESLADRPSSQSLQPLSVGEMGIPAEYEARWALDARHPAPDYHDPDDTVYLPGRNLALLTQAAILAATHGARRVRLGVLRANPFPDATDEFMRAFEKTAWEAMRHRLQVEKPFDAMEKHEVILLGAHLNLSLTLSCARPARGRHCGRCSKCRERREAFSRAGLEDPAQYEALVPRL
jgi:7-cyano-7-deazaguanine synthase